MVALPTHQAMSMSLPQKESILESEIKLIFQSQRQNLFKQLQDLEEQVFQCAFVQSMQQQVASEPPLSRHMPVPRVKVDDLERQDEWDTDTASQDGKMNTYLKKSKSKSSLSEPSVNGDIKRIDTVNEFAKLTRNTNGSVVTRFLPPLPYLQSHDCDDRASHYKCVPSSIRTFLQPIVQNDAFTNTISLLIVVNAAIMAIEVDDGIKRSVKRWQIAQILQTGDVSIEGEPGWFATVNLMFTMAFTIECMVNLLVYELQFFTAEGWTFNLLDLSVVLLSWVEIIVAASADDDSSTGMPPLRIFRLIRTVRSLRLIRKLRWFSDLRLLLLSLVHHVKPLMWSIAALSAIMFTFANIFLQLISASLDIHQPNTKLAGEWPLIVIDSFDGLGNTMVSLFGLITGGQDWDPMYKACREANSALGVVFVVYIGVLVIGILNVISAVFVEAAMNKAKSDRDLSIGEADQMRVEMAAELVSVFHTIDAENKGYIGWEQWHDFLPTPFGQQFLLLFEVSLMQARKMYEILDDDGDGEVVIEEFVTGFMQISGSANKLDIEFAANNSKKMMRKLDDHVKDVGWRLGEIENRITEIAQASPSMQKQQQIPLQQSAADELAKAVAANLAAIMAGHKSPDAYLASAQAQDRAMLPSDTVLLPSEHTGSSHPYAAAFADEYPGLFSSFPREDTRTNESFI